MLRALPFHNDVVIAVHFQTSQVAQAGKRHDGASMSVSTSPTAHCGAVNNQSEPVVIIPITDSLNGTIYFGETILILLRLTV